MLRRAAALAGIVGVVTVGPVGTGVHEAGAVVGPESWSTICPGRTGAATRFWKFFRRNTR